VVETGDHLVVPDVMLAVGDDRIAVGVDLVAAALVLVQQGLRNRRVRIRAGVRREGDLKIAVEGVIERAALELGVFVGRAFQVARGSHRPGLRAMRHVEADREAKGLDRRYAGKEFGYGLAHDRRDDVGLGAMVGS